LSVSGGDFWLAGIIFGLCRLLACRHIAKNDATLWKDHPMIQEASPKDWNERVINARHIQKHETANLALVWSP
jgi:hypothetical protein